MPARRRALFRRGDFVARRGLRGTTYYPLLALAANPNVRREVYFLFRIGLFWRGHRVLRCGSLGHGRGTDDASSSTVSRPLASRTGVVSENMQGLGAKLRKLASQAKICTPPGGEVIAKICVLRYIPFFPLSPPSGGGYVSWEFRQTAAVDTRGACFCENLH